jgi:hypothetical protein
LLGYDRKLGARVADAFASELDRALRRRAKPALGLRTMGAAHTESVRQQPVLLIEEGTPKFVRIPQKSLESKPCGPSSCLGARSRAW